MATARRHDACNCTGLVLKVAVAQDHASVPAATRDATAALLATHRQFIVPGSLQSTAIEDHLTALEVLAAYDTGHGLAASLLAWPDAVIVIVHAEHICTCGPTKGNG